MTVQGIPIQQTLQNYLINLPAFPFASPAFAPFRDFLLNFYARFFFEARAKGADEAGMPVVLEKAQKVWWAFGLSGVLADDALVLDANALKVVLKITRIEETLAVMACAGSPVELLYGGEWSARGKVKDAVGARLRLAGQSGLTAQLSDLVKAVSAPPAKPKEAFERFLRGDPLARLARDKPALDLPPDSPVILANLRPEAVMAWKALSERLKEFATYRPVVEFRSIHHGMWNVNFESQRGGADLCALTVQNGAMTVRVILYGQAHDDARAHLSEWGEPVESAYHAAHWYEEFQHQWLFIPCQTMDDADVITKLIAFEAEALKKRKK